MRRMSDGVRFGRVVTNDGASWARFEGVNAILLDAAPWANGHETGVTIPATAARLSHPVDGAAIFGIGKNYRAHASEMGGDVPTEPLVFTKATSSLLAPGGAVLLPAESARVDYEGELGVVIGKRCRRVSVEEAMSFVFGLTIVCDVTARDLQKKDGQWTRAKGFDTFCPVGPHVVTGVDPANLALSLKVNGTTKQEGSTRDMVFDVARLVAHVSSFVTLSPGDLIATGTPEGVGPLAAGDAVEVTIEHLGALVFSVEKESR
jgi:2-keto-4-pentenoate hydratase/2-oxohepta-3-ene-1,7-dioic acid hydratase in catechol pathway